MGYQGSYKPLWSNCLEINQKLVAYHAKPHCHRRLMMVVKLFFGRMWLGNRSLTEMFPDLIDIALHKDRTISAMWTPQGWDLTFRRGMNDWEIPRLVELFKALSFQGLKEGRDRL